MHSEKLLMFEPADSRLRRWGGYYSNMLISAMRRVNNVINDDAKLQQASKASVVHIAA
jgi:hypothetical protein